MHMAEPARFPTENWQSGSTALQVELVYSALDAVDAAIAEEGRAAGEAIRKLVLDAVPTLKGLAADPGKAVKEALKPAAEVLKKKKDTSSELEALQLYRDLLEAYRTELASTGTKEVIAALEHRKAQLVEQLGKAEDTTTTLGDEIEKLDKQLYALRAQPPTDHGAGAPHQSTKKK
jgi:predicted  nucleic acid-binding Zn-ribbon protein